MSKASIRDVAEKAGVSITTVSRIINNVDYPVSDTIRKRVEEAIKELNYLPNKAAQNLRKRSTHIIGLVVRDIADPFFSQIAKGVTETVMEFGYMAMVCNSERDVGYEYDYLDLLMKQGVDGIIVAGGGYRDKQLVTLLEEKLRIISSRGIKFIALAPQGVDVPLVSADNFKLGECICDYLFSRNHRNIAFIGGDERVFSNHERMEGYKMAFTKRGIKVNDDYIIHGKFSLDGGYKACQELLHRNIPITGICCANDNIAVGVLKCLQEHKIRVPEDISIISMGDLPIARYSIPHITTAAIPLYEMGKKSVEIICGKYKMESKTLHLPFKIIERNSVVSL